MTKGKSTRKAKTVTEVRTPQIGDKVAGGVGGYITSLNGPEGTVEVTSHDGFKSYIYPFSNMYPLITKKAAKPPVPEHAETRPGQVWVTTGGFYFVQVRRKDIALRFTPMDLTLDGTDLKTETEDDFFRKYPDAILAFNDRFINEAEATEAERAEIEEAMAAGNVPMDLDAFRAEPNAASIDLTELLRTLRGGHGPIG